MYILKQDKPDGAEFNGYDLYGSYLAAAVTTGVMIVGKEYRRDGVGSKLVAAVEDAYRGKGYEKIALTTFGFQAPEFYKKLGYELEFVREDKDPKLSKYFYLKRI